MADLSSVPSSAPWPAKPRRRYRNPDVPPTLLWRGLAAAVAVGIVVGTSSYASAWIETLTARQTWLESFGTPTPAHATGRNDPLAGANGFTVDYTFDGVARSGTVYAHAPAVVPDPTILVDADRPALIGIRGGVQGSHINLVLALIAVACVSCILMLWLTITFIARVTKPRRARRKRSTEDTTLPQTFEAQIIARPTETPSTAVLRERRSEVTVSDWGIQVDSLRWQVDPLRIPWTDVRRIHLGPRDGMSGGGTVDAAGWAELSVVPSARLRYRAALRLAGLEFHHSPWQKDLVEVTPAGGHPSWTEATAPGTSPVAPTQPGHSS